LTATIASIPTERPSQVGEGGEEIARLREFGWTSFQADGRPPTPSGAGIDARIGAGGCCRSRCLALLGEGDLDGVVHAPTADDLDVSAVGLGSGRCGRPCPS